MTAFLSHIQNLKLRRLSFFLVLAEIFSATAFASPSLTLQGRITRPDGTVFASSSVNFKVQIISSDSHQCVLYEETQTKDLSASDGLFSVSLNDGSGTRTDSNTWSFLNSLSNKNNFVVNSSGCASGSGSVTYTPTTYDERNVIVYFKDAASGSWEQMPQTTLTHSAYAMESGEVGGFSAQALCRIEDAGVPGNVSSMTTANFTELLALANGTSTHYTQSSVGGGADLPVVSGTPVSPTAGAIWYNSSNNSLQYYDGSVRTIGTSGGSVTSVASGAGLTGGPITTSGTLALAASGVTPGTYPKVTVDTYGRTTGGASLTESDLPNLVTPGKVSGAAINSGTIAGTAALNVSGNIQTSGDVTSSRSFLYDHSGAGPGYVGLQAPANIAGVGGTSYTLTLPAAAGSAGQVLAALNTTGTLQWLSVSTGTVSSVTSANSDIAITNTTTTPVLSLNSGTGANQILKLGNSAKIPAVDGSQLTNLVASQITQGVFTFAQGGAGAVLAPVGQGEIIYSSSSTALASLPAGTSGYVLTSSGVGHAPTWAAVAPDSTKVLKSGDTMTGLLVLSADPSAGLGAASKEYVDSVGATVAASVTASAILKDGSVAFTGNQSMGTNRLTSLADPSAAQDAATKNYVDTTLIGKTLPAAPALAQNGQTLRWNNTTPAWEFYTPNSNTGTVTSVTAGTGLNVGSGPGGSITSTGTLNVNVGTGNNQIVQLDSSARLPAVDGSQLSNLNTAQLATGTLAFERGGTGATLAPAGKGEIVYSNSTTALTSLPAGTANYVLTSAGAGNSPVWAAVPADATKVPLAGGTMTGLLLLSGDPSNVLGAATKQYVDAAVAAGAYVPLAGGTMTGALVNNTNSASTAIAVTQAGSGYAATFMGGNVGIGTTSPASTLDINGAQSLYEIGAASAPSASAGKDFIYADNSTHTLKLSVNGGAYSNIMTSANSTSGTVTSVTSTNTDIGVTNTTTAPVLTLNSGTGASQIVKLDASAKLPAIDGSALSNLTPANLAAAIPITKGGTGQITQTAGFDALAPNTTKGDITVRGTSNNVRLAVGTDNYVLMADSTQTNGVKWAAVPADATKVPLAGGTMTGLLLLSSDPSAALGAATKAYVDAAVASGAYVPLAGGTMTGALINNTNSASTALKVTQTGSGYSATFTGGNLGVGTTSPVDSLSLGSVNASATHASLNLSNTALSGGNSNGTYIGANPAVASADFINYQVNGASKFTIGAIGGMQIASNVQVNGSNGYFSWGGDNYLTRIAAAKLHFGGVDSAAPTAQTLGVSGTVAGTSNTSGADWTLTGSQGTGTGSGGNIFFQTAPSGTSGTSQNALVTAMTISGSGNIGVGITSPTSVLNLKAGTSALAPLQLTAGTNLTTPLAGAIEYDGTNLYYTDSTAARRTIASVNGSTAQTYSQDVTMSGPGTGLAVTNAETVGTTLGVTGLTTLTGGFTSAGAASVTNSTASTSSSTGALTVAGGVGITGSLFSGASINALTSMVSPQFYGSTSASGNISIDGTSSSTKGYVLLNSAGGNVGIGTTTPDSTLNVSSSLTGTSSTTLYGTHIVANIAPTATSSAAVRALDMSNTISSAYNMSGSMYSGWFENRYSGTGSLSGQLGGVISSGLYLASSAQNFGTVSDVNSIVAIPVNSFSNTATGTITSAKGIRINNSSLTNQTIGTQVGLQIDPLSGATNNTGLLIGTITPPSGTFSLYSASTAYSYFAGKVGMGTATPSGALDVAGETHLFQGTYFDPIAGTLASLKASANANSTSNTSAFTAGVNGAAGSNYNTFGGYFNNVSTVSGTGLNYGIYAVGTNNYFSGNVGIGTTSPAAMLQVSPTNTATSSQQYGMQLTPTYNQASGNAANTDFLINRTQTAVGTGNQLLMDAQVGGSSLFSVSNVGLMKAASSYISGSEHVYGNFQADYSSTLGGTTWTVSSGTTVPVTINPIYNQTGNAGSIDLKIFRTETALGSGTHQFANWQAGGVTKFSVSNTGQGYFAGNVGIGTTGPNYKLDVAGDINTSSCFRIGATTVSGTCTSDARLKENIQDYDAGLSELLNVQLHTYTFNGLGEMPKTGEVAVGVIAQELEKTNPDLVKTRLVKMHPDDKEKTEIKVVDYSKFSYMLINAVKELYQNWLDDHAEIQKLKADNAVLKAYLCQKDPQAPICQ